jgi:hypothetical protein
MKSCLFNSLLILLLSNLLACDKKKEDEASEGFQEVNAAFLTSTDFESSNEVALSETDVKSQISSWADLWHYKAPTGTVTSLSSCFQNFKLKIKNTDTLYYGGSEDITACVASIYGSPGMTLNKYKVKVFLELQCEGIDLSQYNNRVSTDGIGDEIETTCGTAPRSVISNSIAEIDFTYSSVNTSSADYSALMSNTGGSCSESFDGTNWLPANNCREYSRQHSIANANSLLVGKDDIKRMNYNNLVVSPNDTDPFFVSGSFDLYWNGWQGSVTYNGVNTPATWTMSKNGLTTTGTLNPSTYLFSQNKKSGWTQGFQFPFK